MTQQNEQQTEKGRSGEEGELERTARLFACDCAQKAMDLVGSPDPRSLTAIEVARRYAQGKATRDELDAAWDAACDAADAAPGAACAAAAAAAWAAQDAALDAAQDAAWAAADAAAWAAWATADATARAAARDAARAAEREWQIERLMQYLRNGGPAFT